VVAGSFSTPLRPWLLAPPRRAGLHLAGPLHGQLSHRLDHGRAYRPASRHRLRPRPWRPPRELRPRAGPSCTAKRDTGVGASSTSTVPSRLRVRALVQTPGLRRPRVPRHGRRHRRHGTRNRPVLPLILPFPFPALSMCSMHCSIRHVLFASPTEAGGLWRCRPHLRSAAASTAGPWAMPRSPASSQYQEPQQVAVPGALSFRA
jgi:hypothetical protein